MNTDLESEALILENLTELQQVVCKSDGFTSILRWRLKSKKASKAEWCNVLEYLLIVKKKEAVGFSNIEEEVNQNPEFEQLLDQELMRFPPAR